MRYEEIGRHSNENRIKEALEIRCHVSKTTRSPVYGCYLLRAYYGFYYLSIRTSWNEHEEINGRWYGEAFKESISESNDKNFHKHMSQMMKYYQ